MSPIPPRCPLRMRSVFISDVHLGFRGCRAGFLLDFLRNVECEQLYLVGDIVDLWSLERTFYWPPQHSDVVRAVLAMARNGTRVIYVPGNHDRSLREFDSVIRASPLLETLGCRAYGVVLRLNRAVNAVRRRLGYPYWSVAAFLKHKVRNAVQYIANFERAVACEARRQGVDGIICGHIHRPEIGDIAGVLYCNDGDWVENCTALVEDSGGRLSLLRWTEVANVVAGDLATPSVALGSAA